MDWVVSGASGTGLNGVSEREVRREFIRLRIYLEHQNLETKIRNENDD
jgi:hypothetical protein